MSNESRRLAGILLIILPTVVYGGVSILSLLIGDPKYMENPLRQDLWRAGHVEAHARTVQSPCRAGLDCLPLPRSARGRTEGEAQRNVQARAPIAAAYVEQGNRDGE